MEQPDSMGGEGRGLWAHAHVLLFVNAGSYQHEFVCFHTVHHAHHLPAESQVGSGGCVPNPVIFHSHFFPLWCPLCC